MLWFVAASVWSQTMVYLEQAESLNFDEQLHPDAQILRGHVRFRHDDAVMYCDSAYFYESTNSLDAFGHVRFIQGDTLFGYGDVLYYDGNSRFARLRRNVRLEDKTTCLTTDSLNYDRVNDIAWYFTGGKIVDSLNVLTSRWGQYTSHNNEALFKGNVHLTNENFVMDADTLKYNTQTHISDILGPTTIVYEEETTIYTTRGWYNTQTEQSELLQHSLIVHTDGNTMSGDTIYYDKQLGFGRALRNIQLVDSADHVTLYGHYGEMWEHGPRGDNSGFATDSALMVDWSDTTAFTYMHADTLFTETIPYQVVAEVRERDSVLTLVPRDSIRQIVPRDSIYVEGEKQWQAPDTVMLWQAPDTVLMAQQPDTLWADTSYRQIRARHRVRIFREDMQAICDSSTFNTRDSIMNLYGIPVMWNQNQQVSADQINVYMKDEEVERVHGIGSAMIIQQKHPIYYNQLSGKEMMAYIEEQAIRRLDLEGNVIAGVFPQDDNGYFVAFNKVMAARAQFFFKEKELDKAVFLSQPSGSAFPLKDLPEADTHLEGFFWAAAERPLYPDDVFRITTRTSRNGQITEEPEEEAKIAKTKNKKSRERDRAKKPRHADAKK